MSLPRRLFAPTTPASLPGVRGRVVKASKPHTTPEAVITYPVRDLQGDLVEPAGIDWSDFNGHLERLVNLEHGPWIGTAEVQFKSAPRLNDQGKPDPKLGDITLPVGVTTFFDSARDAARHTLRKYDAAGRVVGTYTPDECAAHAEQTYPLVMDGTLSGVSLEFQPDGPENVAYKSLGKSPLLSRDAYHFYRTRALGYAAACELPVNQYAGYVPASDDIKAKAEKAFKVCEKPQTLELVRKSLSPLIRFHQSQTPSGRVTAPVRRPSDMSKTATRRFRKADEYLDDEETMNAPPTDDLPPVEDVPDEVTAEDVAPAEDMPATAAAAMQGAQGLMDLCAAVRDLMAKGEHVKGRAKLGALCDKLDGLAAEYQAVADMVLADVGMADDEPVEEEFDDDVEPEPVETDDDGMIEAKAFRKCRWRPHRVALVKAQVFKKGSPWKASDLKPVAVKKAKPGQVLVDAKELDDLRTIAAEYLSSGK